jgi:hypothetical protein
VRSSAPDEDVSSASFAGGYTTLLGVPTDLIVRLEAWLATPGARPITRYDEPLTPTATTSTSERNFASIPSSK